MSQRWSVCLCALGRQEGLSLKHKRQVTCAASWQNANSSAIPKPVCCNLILPSNPRGSPGGCMRCCEVQQIRSGQVTRKKKKNFTGFCCSCCLTGSYLLLSSRPAAGKHQHVEHQRSIFMVHSVTQRDRHWLLRAIVRKQYAAPCACRAPARLGSDIPSCCCNRGNYSRLEHILAGLLCQHTGLTFGKQPVLAERYVHLLFWALWVV